MKRNIVIDGTAITLTVLPQNSRFGTLFRCLDTYGEPENETLAYKTPEEALARKETQLRKMFS